MDNPNDPIDDGRSNPEGTPPLPPEDLIHRSAVKVEPAKTPLELLKAWMATLAIPVPFTLAALVFAAFLLFPAYKGLTSGSTIRQLEETNQELQKQMGAAQIRTIGLERELAGRDLQLTQRQRQGGVDTGPGLFLSPLLYLDGRKSKTPDLINIDFTQADQAILVFSLPKLELQEVEVSIYQETKLVWNQSLAVPQQKLFGENLVTFLVKSSALGKGNYR
ncbi:MAG: hypothetical protein ACRD2L_14840, partial [Terriglobia bacterium]